METKQKEISELSKKHPKLETLMYRVNKDSLKQVHTAQMQKKASGIDGVTKQDYEKNLDENLEELIKDIFVSSSTSTKNIYPKRQWEDETTWNTSL